MPHPEPQAGSSLPVSRRPVPTSPRTYTPGTPLDSLLAPQEGGAGSSGSGPPTGAGAQRGLWGLALPASTQLGTGPRDSSHALA